MLKFKKFSSVFFITFILTIAMSSFVFAEENILKVNVGANEKYKDIIQVMKSEKVKNFDGELEIYLIDYVDNKKLERLEIPENLEKVSIIGEEDKTEINYYIFSNNVDLKIENIMNENGSINGARDGSDFHLEMNNSNFDTVSLCAGEFIEVEPEKEKGEEVNLFADIKNSEITLYFGIRRIDDKNKDYKYNIETNFENTNVKECYPGAFTDMNKEFKEPIDLNYGNIDLNINGGEIKGIFGLLHGGGGATVKHFHLNDINVNVKDADISTFYVTNYSNSKLNIGGILTDLKNLNVVIEDSNINYLNTFLMGGKYLDKDEINIENINYDIKNSNIKRFGIGGEGINQAKNGNVINDNKEAKINIDNTKVNVDDSSIGTIILGLDADKGFDYNSSSFTNNLDLTLNNVSKYKDRDYIEFQLGSNASINGNYNVNMLNSDKDLALFTNSYSTKDDFEFIDDKNIINIKLDNEEIDNFNTQIYLNVDNLTINKPLEIEEMPIKKTTSIDISNIENWQDGDVVITLNPNNDATGEEFKSNWKDERYKLEFKKSENENEPHIWYLSKNEEDIDNGNEDIDKDKDNDNENKENSKNKSSKKRNKKQSDLYEITFDSNGGTINGKDKIVKEINSKSKVEKPENPVREGYKFIGWSLNKDTFVEFDFNKEIEEDTVLYAHWENLDNRHIAYLEGYEDGTIKPENNITREEIATVLYRLSDDKNINNNSKEYKDLNKDKWSYDAINYLVNNNILKGYEDGTIRPENNITRAEVATIITRYKNLNADNIKKESKLTDIDGHWAEESIKIAEENNIIKGYEDNTFKPDENITRAEFTAIINRAFNRCDNINTSNLNKLPSDVEKGSWYFEDIIEATTDHEYKNENNIKSWK